MSSHEARKQGALITGATGGMGSASARLFAQEGAAVAAAARHMGQADAPP